MKATRLEVAGDETGVHVTCLDCGAELEVAESNRGLAWPTLADVADVAEAGDAHRCTVPGEVAGRG